MTKVIGPCFGLDARGTLGKSVTYSIRRGVNYVRNFVSPKDKKSATQLAHREVFQDGVSKWRFGYISASDKEYWDSYASGTSESGYNRFLRYYMKANWDKNTKQKVSPQVIPDPQ